MAGLVHLNSSTDVCDLNKRQGGSTAGFTLIELLVVIAISGLLILTLTGGLRFGSRVWEATQRTEGEAASLDSVERFLRQTIETADSVKGSQNSLAIVGRMPISLARPGLYDITIRSAVGGSMMVDWHTHWRPSGDSGAKGSRLLAEHLPDLEFSYLMPGPPQEGRTDQPKVHWDMTAKTPPLLIRVKASGRDNGKRPFPDLVVAPQVNQSTVGTNPATSSADTAGVRK